MAERVLLVDDEPLVLSALQRQLKKSFDVSIANSGQEAIECVKLSISQGTPYAVVVSDMRMPGLDGIETLSRIKDIAPETVRMMLTGNADLQTAVQAINRGHIFRFFNKPCPAPDLINGINDGIAQYRLISGETQMLRKIQQASRALKTLSAVNSALVHAKDTPQLLNEICKAAVEEGGYGMAWVGIPVQDEAHTVSSVAAYGTGCDAYLADTRISWADDERGRHPVGRAIRLGTTQVLQDVETDADMDAWREQARAVGFSSIISLPISGHPLPFGALTIYSTETGGFIPEEIELLEKMADDMAFGIAGQEVREERDESLHKVKEYLGQLQSNLEGTIKAFAYTIELRDPYTAGHQRRVASLATAIARQLKLPEDRITGLYFAATVHDLGKVKIPAELLSNPGLLSDIEYMMIKVHPQAGYDILKGIAFPWPIAEIVHQHHERYDGTGYPRGLAGDQILLEARILAAADVIEAVASHRPYRASLGIDSALDLIEKGRGTHFAPDVADACLALFREQGYQLEQ